MLQHVLTQDQAIRSLTIIGDVIRKGRIDMAKTSDVCDYAFEIRRFEAAEFATPTAFCLLGIGLLRMTHPDIPD